MSGFLFVRYQEADGKGNGLGDYEDGSETAYYMLAGSKSEWREDGGTFKTNASDKLGLDIRTYAHGGMPVHYYIDSIQLFEVI